MSESGNTVLINGEIDVTEAQAATKAEASRDLHHVEGIFMMPNAWGEKV